MKKYAFIILALGFIAANLSALTWIGPADENGQGLWSDPNNWQLLALPTDIDNLWITPADSIEIIVDSIDAICKNLYLSNGGGGPWTVTVNSGSLTVTQAGWAGKWGGGVGNGLTVNGGTLDFSVAVDPGDYSFEVTKSGTGSGNFLKINGGYAHFGKSVRFAEYGGSSAIFEMTGGELEIDNNFFGQTGSTSMTISGGAMDVGGFFMVKRYADASVPTASFTGGFLSANDFYFCDYGEVDVTFDGGYVRANDLFFLTGHGVCSLDMLSGVIDANIWRYDPTLTNTVAIGDGLIYASQIGFSNDGYTQYATENVDDYDDVVAAIVAGDISPASGYSNIYFAYYPESSASAGDDFYVLSSQEPAVAMPVTPYNGQIYVDASLATLQWSNAPLVAPVGVDGEAVTVDTSIANPNVLAYQIYFGTDKATVATATPADGEYLGLVVGNSVAAPVMDNDTVYYWRIDTAMSDGTTFVKGKVNSFATGVATTEPAYAWSFEDNLTESANGQETVVAAGGTAMYADGFVGKAYKFQPDYTDLNNPIYNYLTLTDTSDVSLFRFGYTVNLWVNKLPDSGWNTLLSKQDRVDGATDEGWIFTINASDQANGSIRDFGSTVTATTAVNDAQWHMATFTYDPVADVSTVYVDGQVEAQGRLDDRFAENSVSDIYIGAMTENGAITNLFTGLVDELEIYSRPLSNVEVAQKYTTYRPDEVICLAPVGEMDLNDDCQVNLEDFAIMAIQWGLCNLIPVEDCLD